MCWMDLSEKQKKPVRIILSTYQALCALLKSWLVSFGLTQIVMPGKQNIATMNTLNGNTEALPAEIETDYLIIGTGPAGAALAAFMASYGKTKKTDSMNPF